MQVTTATFIAGGAGRSPPGWGLFTPFSQRLDVRAEEPSAV